jgi:dCTP deaminase
VRAGVVSYGLSSYGYDIRVADEFKVFTNVNNALIDPKNFDPKSFVDIKADTCIVPPNSFALARTVEYFRIPRDVLTVCLGKSTYARCGIIVNVTPFEPEWEGTATLEISNTTPLPAKVYANEGIAQVLFFQSDEACEISYGDKAGSICGSSRSRCREYESLSLIPDPESPSQSRIADPNPVSLIRRPRAR